MKHLTEPRDQIYMDSHHLQKTWTNGLSSKHGKSFLIPQISQELMSLRQPRKE